MSFDCCSSGHNENHIVYSLMFWCQDKCEKLKYRTANNPAVMCDFVKSKS